MIRSVSEWLDSLDPDEVSRVIEERGFEAGPELVWTHEEWRLTLCPVPLKSERWGKTQGLLASFGDGARFVDTWTPLRDAVKRKGRKNGELGCPLIVAVNADSFHLDRINEMQALFGQEQYIEYVGRPDLGGHMARVPNGAWVGHSGPQSRRVSGAWFFNDLTPYTIGVRRSTLYVNPWAHHEVPNGLLAFPHARVIEESMQRKDGLSFREIFKLPEGWPE